MHILFVLLNLILVSIGISSILRYIVWKINHCKNVNFHYLVLLNDDNPEMCLRAILAENKYDIENSCRVIYAVDVGMNKDSRKACELMCNDYSQIVLCSPDNIKEIIL